MTPSIFIGSTSEGKEVAQLLEAALRKDFVVKPWYEGVFEIGGSTQESLVHTIAASDYCVIVLTADDSSVVRGKKYLTPRDNLLFEAGIGFGSVHSSRTFLVPERIDTLKLATDLNGFTITPSFTRGPSLGATLKPAIAAIREKISESGRRPIQHRTGTQLELAKECSELIRKAEHSVVLFGGDLSWADKYAPVIREQIANNVQVEVFSSIEKKPLAKRHAKSLIDAGAKVHFCHQDPGLKLTLIDHENANVSQYIISIKQRNLAVQVGTGVVDDRFKYRFTLFSAREDDALWISLCRLYSAMKREMNRQPRKRKKSAKRR